jgi:hypothetical protein
MSPNNGQKPETAGNLKARFILHLFNSDLESSEGSLKANLTQKRDRDKTLHRGLVLRSYL